MGFEGKNKDNREFCPNLTSSEDLVNRIGSLSVDIYNKEKVISQMWRNIDDLAENLTSLSEEVRVLNIVKGDNEQNLKVKDDKIKVLNEDITNQSKFNLEQISLKDNKIHELEKTLKSIEGEAVINQEEIRSELMRANNELLLLKQSVKLKPKRVKKKKTNAKPARA